MTARIEDYAIIGDCQTAALVSRAGSIDWLCWPRFDSAACFAALLGTEKNGHWLIGPCEAPQKIERRYRPGTLILETKFEMPAGAVQLIDFMPMHSPFKQIVRVVVGLRGSVSMHSALVVRFDYGSSVPWVTRLEEGDGICAVVGPDMVILRSPVSLKGEGLSTCSQFEIAAGDTLMFSLTHEQSHLPIPAATNLQYALQDTEAYWLGWSAKFVDGDRYHALIERSLITLKALTFGPTGGLVAAVTTSLPEQLGGVRNWDYRYCWLRDATLTLLTLMKAGYYEEAEAWRRWLVRAVAGSPDQVQIMYGIAGERRLDEREIPWLSGYENSAPVRIGNAASDQIQLDVYGELMDALYQARKGGLPADEFSWRVQCAMVTHLETIWNLPDEGIWEVRGGKQNFTYSKIMAWVAFDRVVKSIDQYGLDGPLQHWKALRDQIHADVCRHGFNTEKNSFVQSYENTALDASLLQIPLVGFLPADDPRVIGTVAAIERELIVDGLVRRYRTEEVADGLPVGEGTFLACSFWLADNYVLQGRLDDAQTLFDRLSCLANDVGLLSEEYEPVSGRLIGNFPQAFSHTALIHTALNLINNGRIVDERKE
jgi:GH15 family glucan-1,4-alpha-glucosidase